MVNNMDFRAVLEEPQTPAVISPSPGYDLVPVKQELGQYEGPLTKMEERVGTLTVTDTATCALSVGLEGEAKTLHKNLKRVLDALIAPANDYVKAVRLIFGPYLSRLDSIKEGANQKSTQWQYQVRLEQQRKEAAEREATRKLQEKVDAEARVLREEAEHKAKEAAAQLKKEKDKDARVALEKTIADETLAAQAPTPQVANIVLPTAPKVVRTETGSGYLRMDWTFEITDEAQVPREYLMVNEGLIRNKVKAGIRQIPGVRIFEKPTGITRT